MEVKDLFEDLGGQRGWWVDNMTFIENFEVTLFPDVPRDEHTK